ncbi:MAG TPA: DinB family protein [Candidatus Acidoferrum sp.]
MHGRSVLTLPVLISLSLSPAVAAPAPSDAAGEYAKHFAALSGLSVAVAKAMPPDQYGFRPHPESMDFGQLMSHIATTNYQFCAGLKDSAPPAMPSPTEKDVVVKFLSDSFEYCFSVISNLTGVQLDAVHDSPDGRLPGREVLLAMYIHVAHHRGQAEIYLRDKGVRPPSYRI